MTFPQNEEDKKMDETLDNVLLNALSVFPIKKRTDIFKVQSIAGSILAISKIEPYQLRLDAADVSFLEEVLYESTYQEDSEGKTKGLYVPIVIAQVIRLIGAIPK